jgi:glycerophosphoryl diester phosphodiesterase
LRDRCVAPAGGTSSAATDGRSSSAHRGASAERRELAQAFTAAVAAGADLVELDVTHGLVVAHDAGAPGLHLYQVLGCSRRTRSGSASTLETAGRRGRGARRAIDRFGLRDRAVLSTAFLASPAPCPPPRARRAARSAIRATASGSPALPGRVPSPVRARPLSGGNAGAHSIPARTNAGSVLALHHTLCSRASISAAHRRGVPVFAWTANDQELIRRLAALGVDAIVSDDPKIALATLTAL